MENLWQDLRFSLRMLLKNPGFSAVAVLALALGTGANSAIFSVVNAVLLRPLPYANSERLVVVWGKNPVIATDAMSVPDFLDYRNHNQVFEQMASFAYDDFIITTADDPEHVQGTMVSGNYFSVLGINPSQGRVFREDDEQPGADRVIVVSDGLWKRRFGSDPNFVGSTIMLNGAVFTVVGIAPPNFQSPNPADQPVLWVPMSFDGGDRFRVPSSVNPEGLNTRRTRFLIGIARLKPGISATKAQADLDTIGRQLAQQYKDTNAGVSANIVPLREHITGNVQLPLVILLVAVGVVLLIACVNVANLLLARAAVRQKEIAIRTALGAGRLRLIRQLLTESVLLSVIGGALGLLLAYGELKLLLALNPPDIPGLSEIGIDGRVLAFTFLVAILTGLIFGLAPALQAANPDLNETLKEGARGSTGGINRQRVRSLLVVSEVALTVLLLICAGLMLRSFYALQKVNPGFNHENTLTMMVNLPAFKYPEGAQITAFFEQVIKRIEELPGVQSAGAITSLPLTNTVIIRSRFTVEGRPTVDPSEVPRANFRGVSHNYFRTLRIPLLKGRLFTEQDRDSSPPVVIINETMANRYWPGEEPVGKRMTIPSVAPVPREVVGVVADVKHASLDTESGAEMYVPYFQKPYPFMSLVVHTASDPMKMTGAVRSEILSVDKNQPAYLVKTMQQVLSESVSQPRLYTVLLSLFAALAAILASVGIYGVISGSVSQRTHEIGIRMALGAQRRDIIKMIVGQGMMLAFAGTLIGIVVALLLTFLLTRFIESLLFGVGLRDFATFIGIPFVLAAVAFLSSYIPARRATRIDPMVALRYE
ncbi:MAG: ABC transporter permease [Blastocatellia bacterium]